MSLTLLILMIVVGLGLILLDLFFIPGGIVAFLGLGLIIYADYRSFEEFGPNTGWAFVSISGVASVALIWQFFRPSFWNRFGPKEEITGKVNTEDLQHVKVGDRGVAIGVIRPSGMARINGELVEVHTRNDMIQSHAELEVINIESNRILVRALPTEHSPET